jgi:hypothetical protein
LRRANSPGAYVVFSRSVGGAPRPHCFRNFCSRLRRRIRFLRHFQRIFPRFFHARELLFNQGLGAVVRGTHT